MENLKFILILMITFNSGVYLGQGFQIFQDCKNNIKALHREVLTGDAIAWTYHVNETNYLMSKYEATDNTEARSRFNVTLEGPLNSTTVSLRVYGGEYLNVSYTTEMLGTTADESQRTFFLIQYSNETNGMRMTSLNSSTPQELVTTGSKSPFTFYLKSRYPSAAPADFTFSAFELTVAESYEGKRENINETAAMIHNSSFMNKSSAYGDLINLMNSFGHISGSEIFAVADYMVEDLELEGEVFLKLPSQVQLLVKGAPLGFNYLKDGLPYPFKYYWASQANKNILGYTFSYSRVEGYWAITYAQEHQLGFGVTSQYADLVDTLSPNKTYEFQFALTEKVEGTFQVNRVYKYQNNPVKYLPLNATGTSPTFYFKSGDLNEKMEDFFVAVYP